MWLADTPATCSGRTGGNEGPATIATFGSEIDEPVCGLDDVEVVLDHQDRVALLDQPGEHGEQSADVLEVQASGRLVEQIDRVAGGAFGQLRGQLDPLRLAAGQRRSRLAEADITEADIDEGLEMAGDRRLVGEELEAIGDRHVQDVGDAHALEQDLERVPVVPSALAHFTRHVHVRQEVHLDLDRAVAGAGLAAAAGHVEREPTGLITTDLGLVGLGEQLADVIEHTGVGGRVRARRSTDRRLIDVDHLVEVVEALE